MRIAVADIGGTNARFALAEVADGKVISVDPPLTVVRQPAYAVGRQARELLLKRIIEPAPVPVTVRLRPALVACRFRWRLARQAADKRQNA